MQIRTLLRQAISELKQAGSDSPRLDAELLMMHVTHLNRVQLITHDLDEIGSLEQTVFTALLQKRLQGHPIAHLLGTRDFWKLSLKVTPDTLIPRPDTEVLVEKALTLIECNHFQRVLDLGTGTGAIILSLKHDLPYIKASAVDFSASALQVAIENSLQLGLDVKFYLGSWFEGLSHRVRMDESGRLVPYKNKASSHGAGAGGANAGVSGGAGATSGNAAGGAPDFSLKSPEPRFDIIVSNPPYIEAQDPHLSQGDVRFEPLTALVSGADGLDDIRLIVSQARTYLNEGGYLLLEHGYQQGSAVRALLQDAEYENIETIKDYGLNERVTLGRYYRQHGSKILPDSSKAD